MTACCKLTQRISRLLNNAWGHAQSILYRREIEQVIVAVSRSDIHVVIEILKGCQNEEVARTALCSSVAAYDIQLLEGILQHIGDKDVFSGVVRQKSCNCEKSPMHLACKTGNLGACASLLEAGFLINVVDDSNRTPLWDALCKGHKSVVDFLLSREGIDVNIITDKRDQGITVLMKAAIMNDTPSVIGILKCGPDPNVVDYKRRTPLHFACRYGNIECVRALLSSNVNVNLCDDDGITPLYVACKHGHTAIVAALLQTGTTINNIAGNDSRLCRAEINTSDMDDFSLLNYSLYPLIVAIERCCPDTVKLLTKNGADVNIKLFNNRTPLHVACSEGTLEMVKALHQKGADIESKDSFGKTPLFYCLRNGIFQIALRFCLTNKLDRDSDVVLLKFYLDKIEEGNKIMSYLIKNGAVISYTDNNGKSPLDYAWSTLRTFPTYVLIKYGSKTKWNYVNQFPREVRNKSQRLFPNANVFHLLIRYNNDFRNILPILIQIFNSTNANTSSQESLLSLMADMEQPLSLKDQCRITIRKSITAETGIEFENCIHSLCLPRTLISFLMFEDMEQYFDIRSEFQQLL